MRQSFSMWIIERRKIATFVYLFEFCVWHIIKESRTKKTGTCVEQQVPVYGGDCLTATIAGC